MRTMPREDVAASLEHGPSKRNIAIAGTQQGSGTHLLDGDGQSSDQSRHFIEAGRIVPLNGARETCETFVVGELGNVRRLDGGRTLRAMGGDVKHQNQLRRNPARLRLDLN